jgi:anti-sigma factor ChrR (cupin superfamily)
MRVNADFSIPVVVAADNLRWTTWVASPQAGVERVMLDRIGVEKARATSIVRYAPGSEFPTHQHPGGEEILVLAGAFSEGDAHHGPGSYMRNPPGSAHRPASAPGALLFVKLWQMPPHEHRRVRVDTRNPLAWQAVGDSAVCPLFDDAAERVWLERRPAGADLTPGTASGAEMLVLSGTLVHAGQTLAAGSWLRLPPGPCPPLSAGQDGVTVYLKTGHLSALAAQGSAAGQGGWSHGADA